MIEIMVVVAIIAIVMTMGVPFMRNSFEGAKGMSGALKAVQEAASNARAMAILQQTTTELRIRPGDGTFEVGASAGEPGEHSRLESHDIHGEDWRMGDRKPAGGGGGGGGGGFKNKLPEGVHIEGLGVNGEDWTEDDVARVRFYPNGTCDEMSIILLSDGNERRNIWLEVVTGFAEIESDPHKFKAR